MIGSGRGANLVGMAIAIAIFLHALKKSSNFINSTIDLQCR